MLQDRARLYKMWADSVRDEHRNRVNENMDEIRQTFDSVKSKFPRSEATSFDSSFVGLRSSLGLAFKQYYDPSAYGRSLDTAVSGLAKLCEKADNWKNSPLYNGPEINELADKTRSLGDSSIAEAKALGHDLSTSRDTMKDELQIGLSDEGDSLLGGWGSGLPYVTCDLSRSDTGLGAITDVPS